MKASSAETTGGMIRDLMTMTYGKNGSALLQGEDVRGKRVVSQIFSEGIVRLVDVGVRQPGRRTVRLG
jgi:hypothetical protein